MPGGLRRSSGAGAGGGKGVLFGLPGCLPFPRLDRRSATFATLRFGVAVAVDGFAHNTSKMRIALSAVWASVVEGYWKGRAGGGRRRAWKLHSIQSVPLFRRARTHACTYVYKAASRTTVHFRQFKLPGSTLKVELQRREPPAAREIGGRPSLLKSELPRGRREKPPRNWQREGSPRARISPLAPFDGKHLPNVPPESGKHHKIGSSQSHARDTDITTIVCDSSILVCY